jgi:hypothetical protein
MVGVLLGGFVGMDWATVGEMGDRVKDFLVGRIPPR